MIKININLDKISEDAIKPGKKGRYVDLVLFTNRDGVDQYGNDGFVSEDVTKEQRESGQRGNIVGNWRELGKQQPRQQDRTAPRPQAQQRPASRHADDDIPF